MKPILNQSVLGLFLTYSILIASSVYFYSEKLKLEFNNKTLYNEISSLESKNFELSKTNFELKSEISALQQKFLDKNIEISQNIAKLASDSASSTYSLPIGQILAYTIALVIIIYSINHASNVIIDFIEKSTRENLNFQEQTTTKVIEIQKTMTEELTKNVSENTKIILNPVNDLITAVEKVNLNSSLKHFELKTEAASGVEKILSSIKNTSSNSICDTVADSFLENTSDSAGNLIEVIGSKANDFTNTLSTNTVMTNVTVTQNVDFFANIVELASNAPK